MHKIENKTHKAIDVAAYLIRKVNEDDIYKNDMIPLKLQKLVYICHGWMLGIYGERLIKEDVEAWQYGPVIKELYEELKKYKKSHISSIKNQSEQMFEEHVKRLLDKVLSVYCKYTATELVALTHQQSTPWYKITSGDALVFSGLVIPIEMIREYYDNLREK